MRAEIGEAYEASTTPTRALEQAKGQRLSLRRAIDEFRDVLDAPGAATTERLAPVLDHLKVVFGVHVEVTETTGGLYEEILEIAPRLANKIARFKREHVSISKAIRSSLDDLPDDGLPSPDLRGRLDLLHELLARHRRRRADPTRRQRFPPGNRAAAPGRGGPFRPALGGTCFVLYATSATCTWHLHICIGTCIGTWRA